MRQEVAVLKLLDGYKKIRVNRNALAAKDPYCFEVQWWPEGTDESDNADRKVYNSLAMTLVGELDLVFDPGPDDGKATAWVETRSPINIIVRGGYMNSDVSE